MFFGEGLKVEKISNLQFCRPEQSNNVRYVSLNRHRPVDLLLNDIAVGGRDLEFDF